MCHTSIYIPIEREKEREIERVRKTEGRTFGNDVQDRALAKNRV